MAIIGGTGFGLQGILQGQQIAQNNFALQQLAQQSLQEQFDQNIFGSLVGQGFSPTQAFGSLAQNSPILGSALQNTGRGLSLQQALLPNAIAGAQQGQFGQLNQLANAFGAVGNFNERNFNTNAVLPLLGNQGLSAQQNNLFNERLIGNLLGGGGLPGQTQQPTGFRSLPNLPSFGQGFGNFGLPNAGSSSPSFGLSSSFSPFGLSTSSSSSGSAAQPFGFGF